MVKSRYLSFLKYDIVSSFLGTLVWTSLATFTITVKGLLDVEVITVLESLIFISTIVGVYLAYNSSCTLRRLVLLEIVLETIFLIFILILIVLKSNYISVAIYFVIILGRFIMPLLRERHRMYQDKDMKKSSEKVFLSKLRKKTSYLENIAGVIGSIVAILFVTVFKVDIYTFAIMMLIINVIQNGYDYYKWIKYLR